MRRIIILLATLALALAASVAAPSPASAHNPNVYSYWACGATRLDSQDFVVHAIPETLTPDYLFSYCRANWFDGSHGKQWWAVTSVATGQSVVWGTWYFCYLGEYCAPEPN